MTAFSPPVLTGDTSAFLGPSAMSTVQASPDVTTVSCFGQHRLFALKRGPSYQPRGCFHPCSFYHLESFWWSKAGLTPHLGTQDHRHLPGTALPACPLLVPSTSCV